MTIEEKAKELFPPCMAEIDDVIVDMNQHNRELSYQLANFQKKIDIEKTVEFMVKHELFGCRDSVLAQQFKKTMEE